MKCPTSEVFNKENSNEIISSYIKELRLELDSYIGFFDKTIYDGICLSREMLNAYDSLRNAKAWSGRTLAVLGGENPYPKSDDVSTGIIDPIADRNPVLWESQSNSPVIITKELRVGLKALLKDRIVVLLELLDNNYYGGNFEDNQPYINWYECYNNLVNSINWLGWELNNLKQLNIK